MPTLGAIPLLGAWLLVRVPRRRPLVAVMTLAVVAALSGLGGWASHDMYSSRSGRNSSWCPDLGVMISGPGGVTPGPPGRAVRIGPPGAQCPPGIMTASLSAASRRASTWPERGRDRQSKPASGALRGACSLAPIA
jgi:hypothetical protein